VKSLVQIDDPKHREMRDVTADWFKPRALARLDERIAELARQAVDRMAERGTSCDFATEIAMPMPLEVILSLLGLPDSDYPRMLKLTQEVFGNADPDLSRDGGVADDAYAQALFEIAGYFSELIADRKANPTEDLAQSTANRWISSTSSRTT
jgi:cytochrome P450